MPCLFVMVLVIIAIPEKDNYIIDLEGDLDAYEDPELVNNSSINFFYRNDQLAEYRKQKKPEKAKIIKMSDNIVTTDFTKQNVSILPNTSDYTGPSNLIVTKDEVQKVQEYVEVTETDYTLKGGDTVAKEDSFEVILDTGFWGGNPGIPHRIDQVNKYYAAFTEELQSMYFVFTSSNEFASIRVTGLTGRVQYSLYNSEMKELKTDWNHSSSTLDVQYKGRGSDTYYLKLTGSFSETVLPFCVEIPSDDNEWMWQMVHPEANTEVSGRFDYYGDEDFYVLPPFVTENINKSSIRFTKITADTNVVVYDKDRKILAQYVYKPGQTNTLSLYALENAYAVSCYSYAGQSSGTEYSFVLEHIDSLLLDIQTYGFALNPGYSEDEDYYTATVSSLEQKQITEIMATIPDVAVSINVAQQCGYEYKAKVGQDLVLGPGRNVITITLTLDDMRREITIVISNSAESVYYAYTDSGKKLYVVQDNPENSYVTTQKEDGSYKKIGRSEIYTYVETTVPSSYKDKITELRQKHPNWKFTFVKTGYDFDEFVDSQDRMEGSTPVSAINGKRATREQIEYYVDPRNFLNEQSVFMFEKQSYTEGIYSPAGIASIWVEKPEAVLPESTFISFFTEAAASAGVSPYFITARAQLESGNGTSKLALGQITGCEGFYNFYGINAMDSNPSAGGEFAKNRNWNTRRKAIIEGAAWIKNQYIGCMQFSAYFMKYSFIPTRAWHQYMTDIAAPYKDAQSYYKAHLNGGTLDSEIEFVIPVFDNMP